MARCRYAWGRNTSGQLGVNTSTELVLIPRPLPSLRAVIVAVAAANHHSVALSAHGAVFTWGANTEGQLGYATRGGGCNWTPKTVDSIKERRVVAVRRVLHVTRVHCIATLLSALLTGRNVLLFRSFTVFRSACYLPSFYPPLMQSQVEYHVTL